MEKTDTRIIIIPDIHGRAFWKEAVKDSLDIPVVFLGDYLDPYPIEGITQEMAWENFMEIAKFKRSNPERVHLLLGNHDLGYVDRLVCSQRRDWENAGRNRHFLVNNLDIFDLAYEDHIAGKRFLFTHAGVNRKWMEYHFGADTEANAEFFNGMLHSDDFDSLMRCLRNVSSYRGGDWPWGSPIWADIHEFNDPDTIMPGIIQMVGHTQQETGPVKVAGGNVTCLDCKKAFQLDSEGNIMMKQQNL